MKILFISSGYTGIYEHLETWISKELSKKHEVIFFHIKSGLRSLQTITRSFIPEIAITLVGFKLPIRLTQWLQAQQIKTAVWFTEDPYYMDQSSQLALYYDFVFTIDSAALEFYKKNGHKNAYQLPLATEPQVFRPKEIEERFKSDICIVGYPYPERIQYIQLLLQNTPYQIKLVGKWRKLLYRYLNNPKLTIHEGWVEPSIAADYYNGAKIVLNTHRPFNLKQNQNRVGIDGKSINNRTFDVAACETFQLIDFKEDLQKFFIEDEEMVSYRSSEELFSKINHYMQFEDERQRIAANARNRVLNEHTFEHRLDNLLNTFNNASLKME